MCVTTVIYGSATLMVHLLHMMWVVGFRPSSHAVHSRSGYNVFYDRLVVSSNVYYTIATTNSPHVEYSPENNNSFIIHIVHR